MVAMGLVSPGGPGAMWRSIVQVSGQATEVLGINHSAGQAQLQLLLVPGNPGSALYYGMQMQQLYNAFGGGIDVLAVSHAGHSSDPSLQLAGGAVWSLDSQIRHKADFIQQHLLLPGRPPLVVAGHSIGAHMAVYAVARVESDAQYLAGAATLPSVLKVVGMFPFFWIDQSQYKIKLLSLAAARYEIMGRLAEVMSLLPRWLLLSAIRRFTRGTMEPGAVAVTAQLLTRRSVRNFFYLAHTEFRDLKQPPAWQLFASFGHRLHVLGCPEDVWMSKKQYEHLHSEVPGVQLTWVEEARHAYCTSTRQCQAVTNVVRGIVLESLAQHQKHQQPLVGLQADSQANIVTSPEGQDKRVMANGSNSRL